MRHRTNRFDVLGDVVSNQTVTAGGCVFEPAVFVEHRNRHAVHFRFDHDRDLFVRQKSRDPFVEIRDLIFGIRVVETQHRNPVLNLGERLKRLATHALSRGIRRDQFRKFRFQIDQFFVKPIVFAIANRWRGFFVVATVVLLNLVSELSDSLRRLRLVFGHEP